MIEALIDYIDSRIDSLGHFKEFKGLCELINKTDKDNTQSFPAKYCSKGEYKQVSDFDFKKGREGCKPFDCLKIRPWDEFKTRKIFIDRFNYLRRILNG